MQITLSLHSPREPPHSSIFNNYDTTLWEEQQWPVTAKALGSFFMLLFVHPLGAVICLHKRNDKIP